MFKSKSSQLETFSNSFASIFCGNTLLLSSPPLPSSLTCGATGCAACGAVCWSLPVTSFGIRVSLNTGVVELNTAWLASLVLVAMPAMKLGDSDALAVGVVLFAPSIAEGVVEELIVAYCDCCLMASASDSFHYMPQLRL